MKHDESLNTKVAQFNSPRAWLRHLEALKNIVGNEANQHSTPIFQELGQYLRGREGENGQYFRLEEFIQRVSEKEGVEPTAARNHAQAVFAVLQQAVTPGEADVRSNLSEDYEDLFPPAQSGASV